MKEWFSFPEYKIRINRLGNVESLGSGVKINHTIDRRHGYPRIYCKLENYKKGLSSIPHKV